MKRPKEDPADKAARLRERRISELDQKQSAQKNAAGMAKDLRAVYGFTFGRANPPSVFATAPTSPVLSYDAIKQERGRNK